ncbi:MAG: UPF0147 family protein [archaeon]|jgi:uncharacterized protein (UPF0147 family)
MEMGEDLVQLLEEILSDRSVPRNIREKVETAIQKVKMDGTTALSEAIIFSTILAATSTCPSIRGRIFGTRFR